MVVIEPVHKKEPYIGLSDESIEFIYLCRLNGELGLGESEEQGPSDPGADLCPLSLGNTILGSYPYVIRKGRGGSMANIISQACVEFLKREDGPTAVEYAVMLALIVVVCISAISVLGSNANSTFSKVGSAVKTSGS